MESEEVQRDEARVEEYEKLYTGVSLKAAHTLELRTGIIPAARFADKVRRVTLAAFKKTAPRDVIVRDVAEFNKALYETIVNKMKCEKGDLIRIVVEASYDEDSKRIVFGEPVIERYVPENQVRKEYEEKIRALEKELEEARLEAERYREKLEKISRELEKALETLRK